MPFEEVKRQSVVVWVYSLRQLKNLKRFGLISYVSKKMKYIIIYMNQDEVALNVEKIKKLHFVRNVEISHRPEVDMNFGARVGKIWEEEQALENENEKEENKALSNK